MVTEDSSPENLLETQEDEDTDERVEQLIAVLGVEDVTEELAEIGASAVGPLLNALRHRKDGLVKYNAALALTRIGKSAVRGLLKSLEDSDPDVRLEASWALGEIGDERAIEPLISGLKDEDWYVRQRAASALVTMQSRSAVKPLIAGSQG